MEAAMGLGLVQKTEGLYYYDKVLVSLLVMVFRLLAGSACWRTLKL
jgi:hypothetical protein